jgi:hypothetical protein
MPTRRVALDGGYLPTNGPAFGAVLLGSVMAESLDGLDDEQWDVLPRLIDDARRGELSVPRIALRYRLQTDIHGLDRSRHRIVEEAGVRVVELDVHGASAPQVLGAVMAAAALPASGRRIAFRAIDAAVARPGALPEGLIVRRLFEGVPGARPFAPGSRRVVRPDDAWRGVPAERRWAMEVLGLHAGMPLERIDVQARFRRLVRQAHPDHGAVSSGAAERIAELSEAREMLLAVLAAEAREDREDREEREAQ